MQGNADVKAGLQQLITALSALMCQYLLDAINTKRLGLEIGEDLKALHEQCEEDLRDFVRWLYFLEGAPQIGPAQSRATVADILNGTGAAETEFVALATDVAKRALAAGDFGVLHAVEHAIKFHTIGSALGSTERKGHIAWLQKQGWQLGEFGEKEYEETKV